MRKLLIMLFLALIPLYPHALDTEFNCLVQNVYQEARGESYKGKVAVALVTINRTKSERFPSTICGVVYQKNQFSWTNKYGKTKINNKQWQEAKDAAFAAYMNTDILGYFPATHFHNISISPGWKLKKVAKIGNHYFYTI